MKFVCGFMFHTRCNQVLLIEKKRPKWQAGLLNGIGGKLEKNGQLNPRTSIEEYEDPAEAMVREFREETRIETKKNDWDEILQLRVNYINDVYFFRTFTQTYLWKQISNCPSPTDEKLYIFNLDNLISRQKTLVKSLTWIIPMCLDTNVGPQNRETPTIRYANTQVK
jgi:8-oxo-dGTP diphosphatase